MEKKRKKEKEKEKERRTTKSSRSRSFALGHTHVPDDKGELLDAVYVGVHSSAGRVKVPSWLPEPPYTTQFLEQAASPVVLDVCQQGEYCRPCGGSPSRFWPRGLVPCHSFGFSCC